MTIPVYLVGAGPGDPELLTVKAARLLAIADVVVHDNLVDPAVLALIPEGVERIDVGKRPGRPTPQDVINALLVHLGSAGDGRTIVRLKGGDPFVFGRGGEEARALVAAGIPVEIVPGISSAIAAPAAAGIPVTQRGVSAAFTVVTGHRESGRQPVNWEALATVGGTIVVLMGVAQRGEIARRLIAGGLAADTPVCAIERGTCEAQRVVRTVLGSLEQTAVASPATMVIGAVAAYDVLSAVLAPSTVALAKVL